MLTFEEFRLVETDQEISETQYYQVLEAAADEHYDFDRIDEDFGGANEYASGKIANLIRQAREDIERISRMVKIGFKATVLAFKNPSMYRIVRAFSFSFSALFGAMSEASSLVLHTLNDILSDLGTTMASEEVDMHAEYIEQYIDRSPALQRLSGATLAGFMVYFWLNMTFIGNFKYDMNVKNVAYAVAGQYTLKDFLLSTNGRSMLVLFGTGAFVSFPWLGSTVLNLSLAVVYTGLVISRETGLANKIRSKIRRK